MRRSLCWTVRLFANRTVSGALAVFLLSPAALGGVYSLFTQLDAGTSLAVVIASFVITYPGVAPSMALTTDLVESSVPPAAPRPPDRAGAGRGRSDRQLNHTPPGYSLG
ncbi:hypothetical protein [Citricoccus sp. NR2]|uniref:hypothetical protein n=1 Tax=Citricoccus sp. NR2 TaxID=3004095 RepID=UPI0022DD6541|nr:hypothetical protein [Citricoccus sp. NR2]WBL19096.1 hypothetical protein O1A05_15375 [Citricoccus sp. NR2]